MVLYGEKYALKELCTASEAVWKRRINENKQELTIYTIYIACITKYSPGECLEFSDEKGIKTRLEKLTQTSTVRKGDILDCSFKDPIRQQSICKSVPEEGR